MVKLQGLRYIAFLGVFIGFTSAMIYPIIISPMINSDYYKNMQREGRKGITQEEIQPGNMKVWSDPFGRK